MVITNDNAASLIAEQVAEAGGRAYFVGGYVRDALLGIENKDIDVEVHGVQPEMLKNILDSMGESVEMGASFGVFGLKGIDIDIAMPRKEENTGRGHKDFKVDVDPFIGTYKAAERRDFTVNSLMQDVLTGEIIDHFGGREDLERKILRHINEYKFPEDPLRVLRCAQFASRFGFDIAPETIKLSSKMDLSYLASERVFEEMKKALLKSDKPSVFFETLRKMNQLDVWFPEVKTLIDTPQHPKWHPEGDVWNHTMLVIDQAAKLRDLADNKIGFMLGALCHDFGKPVTTEVINGEIHSYNHEVKGVPIAENFLKRLTGDKKLISYADNLVRYHMSPNMMVLQNAGQKSFNRLFDSSEDPNDLLLLSKADILGNAGNEEYDDIEKSLKEHLDIFNEIMSRPYVMGRDLIDAGLEPGEDFTEILNFAHKLRLASLDKSEALSQTLGFARSLRRKKNN